MIATVDMELATAEFEATWLEVRYHEGGATVAEVQAAIRRVDALRRTAATITRRRAIGATLSWQPSRPLQPIGN
jgi:hypothetical protein